MKTQASVASIDTCDDPPMWPRESAAPDMAAHRPVVRALARFAPIGLAEMDAVALMNRVDTKYVLGAGQLPALLAALAGDYRVLEVRGVRLNHYHTLYFDTPDLDLYARHHAGRAERFKVRSRAYLDSGASFLEVKRKTNKGRTVKERMRTEALLTRITPEAARFVDGLAPAAPYLGPVLANAFARITLVGRQHPERATIDLDLRFQAGDLHLSLTGVAVVEIKQERADRTSPLIAQMRALGIRPTAFSKYCVGVALLYPAVRHNRFKPVLNRIEQIMRGNYYGERTGHSDFGRNTESRRRPGDRAVHLLPAYS